MPITNVKGHTRKTKSGKRVMVRPHKRTLSYAVIQARERKLGQAKKRKSKKKPYDMIGGKAVYGFRDAAGDLVGDPVTVVQDSMGSLHIWEGIQDVTKTGKYTFESAGKEAQHFLQVDTDIAEFLRQAPKMAKEEIEGGYTTVMTQMWY